MLIDDNAFKGIVPRVAKRSLNTGYAQTAKECDLLNGDLRALNDTLFDWSPTKAGTINSIFRYADQYWFHWLEDVDVVTTPIAGDVTDRVIFTGIAAGPKVTDNTIAVQGGGTNYPNNAYLLGIPAPPASPSVSGTPNADPALNEDRRYAETYVSAWAEEGPQSPLSAQVSVDPNVVVNLSALNTVPPGNYNITQKRIYRSVDPGDGSVASLFLVATIPVAQTTYADTVSGVTVASNGEIKSSNWDMPPTDLTGIIDLPNGVLAGVSGNQLCLSVPYQPHAWPVGQRYAVSWPIVGIGAYGSFVVITTTGLPYVVSVIDPAFVIPEKIEIEQSCVSKRGIVDMGYAVAYPTPDGLALIGMGAPNDVVTRKLLRKEDWEKYNPPSIHAYFFDGRYIAFYDATAIGGQQGGFILDPLNPDIGLVETDLYATAGFTNRLDDSLYLVIGGNIVKWEGAATKRTNLWKSGITRLPRPVNMSSAQVIAETYPVTYRLYADGALKHTEVVADSSPFRLPSGYLADEYERELSGEVSRCLTATSMDELRSA